VPVARVAQWAQDCDVSMTEHALNESLICLGMTP
jgi:hypothetical protein